MINKTKKILVVVSVLCAFFWAENAFARSIGQFYWYLPDLRFNTSSLFQRIAAGNGFSVTVGEQQQYKHLADIGLLFYNIVPQTKSISTALSIESRIGYVHHWSNNYDVEEKSDNVHIGVGVITKSWRTSRIGLITDVNGNLRSGFEENNFSSLGYYFRIGYFRSFPKNQPLLVGFNISFKVFTVGIVQQHQEFETDPPSRSLFPPFIFPFINNTRFPSRTLRLNNPSEFNSIDLGIIIGTRF